MDRRYQPMSRARFVRPGAAASMRLLLGAGGRLPEEAGDTPAGDPHEIMGGQLRPNLRRLVFMIGRDSRSGQQPSSEKVTHVGRRTVLGLVGLGVAGIAVGPTVDNAIGGALTKVAKPLGGLASLVPGASGFRIYTITGSI